MSEGKRKLTMECLGMIDEWINFFKGIASIMVPMFVFKEKVIHSGEVWKKMDEWLNEWIVHIDWIFIDWTQIVSKTELY